MDLTSLRRVKNRYGFIDNSNDNEDVDAHLQSFISSWSNRIKDFCRRDFTYSDSHVEFFNAADDRRHFRVNAYPIESVTSVAIDPTGKYNNPSQYYVVSSDYYILSPDNRAVVFNPNQNLVMGGMITPYIGYSRIRNVRIAFTGGLAEHGTRINITLSNTTGISAGDSLTGNISSAKGYVLSASGTSALVDVLYGAFEDGEMVTNGTVTKTLVQHDSTAIAETDVTLTNACEIMTRHSWKMLTDPGYRTSERDRTDRFTPADLAVDYTFLPEVRDMLEPYVNHQYRRG